MRLQLTAAAALRAAAVALGLVAATGAPARGQAASDRTAASASLSIYADDDSMTVISPAVGASIPAGRITADVGVAADTVTGASVDVVTSASPSPIHEQREQLSLGATALLPHHVRAIVRAIGSTEHDYDVIHGWALAQAELTDRDLVVEVGYDHGRAWVGKVGDPTFAADRTDDRVVVRASQVLDRRTYLDVLVDLSRIAGYQASPYRLVAIAAPASTGVMLVGEATPRLRHAVAAAVRLRRAVGERWFVHAGYRAAIDDWGVVSHTGRLLAIAQLDGGAWRLGAEARGYLQGGADFYQVRYVSDDGVAPGLRTRDRTLGPMRSAAAELTGDRAVGRAGLRVQLAVGASHFWWLEDLYQRGRTALTTTVAVTGAW
jgi:Protein of unknown function (DUF3570)